MTRESLLARRPWFGPPSASALSSCSRLDCVLGAGDTVATQGDAAPVRVEAARCGGGLSGGRVGLPREMPRLSRGPEPTPEAVTSCSTRQVRSQFLPLPSWAPEQDGTVCGRESLTGPSGGGWADAPVGSAHACVHGGTIHGGHRGKQPSCPLTGEELNRTCPGRAGGY